jgi:hypothetical protein
MPAALYIGCILDDRTVVDISNQLWKNDPENNGSSEENNSMCDHIDYINIKIEKKFKLSITGHEKDELILFSIEDEKKTNWGYPCIKYSLKDLNEDNINKIFNSFFIHFGMVQQNINIIGYTRPL